MHILFVPVHSNVLLDSTKIKITLNLWNAKHVKKAKDLLLPPNHVKLALLDNTKTNRVTVVQRPGAKIALLESLPWKVQKLVHAHLGNIL